MGYPDEFCGHASAEAILAAARNQKNAGGGIRLEPKKDYLLRAIANGELKVVKPNFVPSQVLSMSNKEMHTSIEDVSTFIALGLGFLTIGLTWLGVPAYIICNQHYEYLKGAPGGGWIVTATLFGGLGFGIGIGLLGFAASKVCLLTFLATHGAFAAAFKKEHS